MWVCLHGNEYVNMFIYTLYIYKHTDKINMVVLNLKDRTVSKLACYLGGN